MIDFMVIAAPRCGTTWAANWLTTDTTLCLHDPLYTRHYDDLDAIESKKMLGVSCTGLYHFPGWVRAHPARKVILHRPLAEINESLDALGFPLVTHADLARLDEIDGMHLDWKSMFSDPAQMYEFLTKKEFDAERHSELVHIEMQPKFIGLTINKDVGRRFIEELRGM